MKYGHLLLILLSNLLLSCDDDDYPYAEVPSVVLNEFWAEYPKATDAEFSQFQETYEVEFEIGDNDYKALFDSSGSILKKKREISWSSLPPAVRNSLRKQYGEKDIKDPEVLRTGDKTFYQAEVRRFFSNEKVVLNEAGKTDTTLIYWK
ncbi:PepSY-like domain-containing protein [Salinimicrobium sp. TH3]|uniref:PepSY-like domain-containing protein n=1 Tax=Salinimicrobium sp. TH3 TaxID=2997342 RepID=UPI0022728A62|nr:PepSY-like domain-containing protein [Salinimicrobium sp. TH3]MCY2687998.1 PepSY-like domain-containing protein [Salinimicrobium sp. TH3]